MREILADLVAEQQGLDQSLQRAPDRDWKKRVEGFTVQQTIAILAWEEQHAARALTGDRTVRKDVNSYDDLDAFVAAGAAKGKGKRPQEVIEWWRFARADVVDALSRMKPDERVTWIDGKVSARTFATLRLAETWARGLAILEGLDKEIVDTPRLRHVAWLGWATLPHAFKAAGESYGETVRVELVGPGYARWVFGPEGADQVIRGQAGEWCRLVIGRLDARKAESLSAIGDVAETALEVAGIFV
jgi:uncharacterized protein (TIGR03084 family)